MKTECGDANAGDNAGKNAESWEKSDPQRASTGNNIGRF